MAHRLKNNLGLYVVRLLTFRKSLYFFVTKTESLMRKRFLQKLKEMEEMERELWEKINLVHEGKVDMTRKEEIETILEGYSAILEDSKLIASLEGRGEVFIEGGKVLIGAGAIWFAVGKLSMFAARKVRDQYKRL